MKYIGLGRGDGPPRDGELVHARPEASASRTPGQVKYIFSDKTGTLTRNEMKLRRVVVRGKCYGLGREARRKSVLPTTARRMIHSRAAACTYRTRAR